MPSPHAYCTQVAQLCRFLQAAGDMIIDPSLLEGDDEGLENFSSAVKIRGDDSAPLTSEKSPCGSPKSKSHSQMARDMQRELSEMLLKLPGDPNVRPSVCSHRVLCLKASSSSFPLVFVSCVPTCACASADMRQATGALVCARGVRVLLSTSVFTHARIDCLDSENGDQAALNIRCEEKLCVGMLDPAGDPVASMPMSTSRSFALLNG